MVKEILFLLFTWPIVLLWENWSRMRTEDSIESDCKRVRVTIDQLGRVTLATLVTMVTMARANKIWCVSCDIPDGGLSDAQGRGLLSLHAGGHSS